MILSLSISSNLTHAFSNQSPDWSIHFSLSIFHPLRISYIFLEARFLFVWHYRTRLRVERDKIRIAQYYTQRHPKSKTGSALFSLIFRDFLWEVLELKISPD